MELRAGAFGALDDASPVVESVDNCEFARDGNIENGALLRDLELSVVDVGVGKRILDLCFRDRFGELVGPLQCVAAGDMSCLGFVLSLDDDDVVARVRDGGPGITAGCPGPDDSDVVLERSHVHVSAPWAQNSLLY